MGETLVSEVLARDDELLDVALSERNSREEIRQALTVLTRLGRRVREEQTWLRRALERHLAEITEEALYVGVETGSPLPEIYAEVIRHAETRARRRAVDSLRIKLPKETTNLKSLGVEVRS